MARVLTKERNTREIPPIKVGNRTVITEEELKVFAGTMKNQFSNNKMGNRITDQRINQFLQELEANEDQSGVEEEEKNLPEEIEEKK